MLKNTPPEILQAVLAFLQPKDFYNLRTCFDISHDEFWYSSVKKPSIELAAKNGCISLVKYQLLNTSEQLTREECESIFLLRNAIKIQMPIYGYYAAAYNTSDLNAIILRKAKYEILTELISKKKWIAHDNDLSVIINMPGVMVDKYRLFCYLDQTMLYDVQLYMYQIIDRGYLAMFEYILRRYEISMYIIDYVYSNKRWQMFALIFKWHLRLCNKYMFGEYKYAADPKFIHDIGLCLPYMQSDTRIAVSQMLKKYHDWLFLNKYENAINTIDAIRKLQLFAWNPSDYLDLAVKSGFPSWIQYLSMHGLQVSAADYIRAGQHDLNMALDLYEIFVAQQINNLMIILIAAVIISGIVELKSSMLNYEASKAKMAKEDMRQFVAGSKFGEKVE